jgi:hypothetical protein
MGAASVVLGQDRPQMPLADHQHPVSDFGPGGGYESLGISVRPWAAGRDRQASMPAAARTASNDAVNCPARSRDQEPKACGAIT